MASDRPFPPSARRLALARAAGLTPASPIVVGAAACIGAVVALAFAGHAMFSRLAESMRNALGAADGFGSALGADGSFGNGLGSARTAIDAAGSGPARSALDGFANTVTAGIDAREVVMILISLALPVLGAIAIAAVLAHLAQTRALWIPRRQLPNAPVEDPQRGTRGAMAIANAIVIAIVAVVWLYAMAPRLAALVASAMGADASGVSRASAMGADASGVSRASAMGADASGVSSASAMGADASGVGVIGSDASAWGSGALLVLSFLAALAIAWVALGAIDALVRFAAHTRAMRMTPEEQRADQRLAGADPRWRARREKLARGEPVRDAVAGASVLVLGDGVAVAVAWDPVRRPVPTRTASGRAARATQLLGLARRHAIAVHRDAELATLLATGDGPVPERHWPRLAEIVAATRRRTAR